MLEGKCSCTESKYKKKTLQISSLSETHTGFVLSFQHSHGLKFSLKRKKKKVCGSVNYFTLILVFTYLKKSQLFGNFIKYNHALMIW